MKKLISLLLFMLAFTCKGFAQDLSSKDSLPTIDTAQLFLWIDENKISTKELPDSLFRSAFFKDDIIEYSHYIYKNVDLPKNVTDTIYLVEFFDKFGNQVVAYVSQDYFISHMEYCYNGLGFGKISEYSKRKNIYGFSYRAEKNVLSNEAVLYVITAQDSHICVGKKYGEKILPNTILNTPRLKGN